jgi:hypothetical protein
LTPSIAAGLLLGLHYKSIIDLLGFYPFPVVCGTNGREKTKAANAALCLIGNSGNFYLSVKQRFIPRLCIRSSLPPVIDDVKIPNILEDAAISFYNNGKDGMCLQETEPRTCPLLTVNYTTLHYLNKGPRYKQLHLDMIEIHVWVSDSKVIQGNRITGK